MSQTILEILRAETREDHDAVEDAMQSNRIFSDGFSLAEYALLLKRLYLAHERLEASLLQYADAFEAAGMETASRLNKRDLLRADLQAMGIDINVEGSTLAMEDEIAAWGAFYVLEGSSLGANVIFKKLRKKDWSQDYFHFYGAYGEETGQRWGEFSAAFTAAVPPSQSAKCLAGARAAYQVFIDSAESIREVPQSLAGP